MGYAAHQGPSLSGEGPWLGPTGGAPFRRGAEGEIVVDGLDLLGLFQVRTQVGFSQQCGEQRVLLLTVHEREVEHG